MSGAAERPTAPIIRCPSCMDFIELTRPPNEAGAIILGSFAVCPCGRIIQLSEALVAGRHHA